MAGDGVQVTAGIPQIGPFAVVDVTFPFPIQFFINSRLKNTTARLVAANFM